MSSEREKNKEIFQTVTDRDGMPINILANSVAPYGDIYLPLCSMCQFSKMDCENADVREAFIPLEEGDPPELEVFDFIPSEKGEFVFDRIPTGLKSVDGVKAGIYTSPDQMEDPVICTWFEPKTNG